MESKNPSFAERIAQLANVAEQMRKDSKLIAAEVQRMQQANARFEARKSPEKPKH